MARRKTTAGGSTPPPGPGTEIPEEVTRWLRTLDHDHPQGAQALEQGYATNEDTRKASRRLSAAVSGPRGRPIHFPSPLLPLLD